LNLYFQQVRVHPMLHPLLFFQAAHLAHLRLSLHCSLLVRGFLLAPTRQLIQRPQKVLWVPVIPLAQILPLYQKHPEVPRHQSLQFHPQTQVFHSHRVNQRVLPDQKIQLHHSALADRGLQLHPLLLVLQSLPDFQDFQYFRLHLRCQQHH